jgi:hypothetical protein
MAYVLGAVKLAIGLPHHPFRGGGKDPQRAVADGVAEAGTSQPWLLLS